MESPPLYRPWDSEKIRAISSMNMKHVSIAGTWTGISYSSTQTKLSLHSPSRPPVSVMLMLHNPSSPPTLLNFLKLLRW